MLWEVRTVPRGEMLYQFVSPVGWWPGKLVQDLEVNRNVRFFRLREIPRLDTDEAVLAYCKRE